MSKLKQLQTATNLKDLAKILGYAPSGLSFIIYKLDASKKYKCFTIPKKYGGVRKIKAPCSQLSLLQTQLNHLLNKCVEELQSKHPNLWSASHGFRNDRTIISNADAHRHKRYVLNVDLKNFFGTINFGRVRGFFIKDKLFHLQPSIATLIAQIATYENELPQGSPCSPIISNLIGNILDIRLIALAKKHRCTFSRYVDDLTFSTNLKEFPPGIALSAPNSSLWMVGEKLRATVEYSGFELNESKTRMSLRQSRQTVTGLVVNHKPNINQHYYRTVRSMCNSLFHTGEYCRNTTNGIECTDNLNPLEGMLSFIHFVKQRNDRSQEANKHAKKNGGFIPPTSPTKLYERFLFYKYFVALTAPIVVTEGHSDVSYLKCAIRSLANSFPGLVRTSYAQTTVSIKFLNPSRITKDIMNLGNGTSGQGRLINVYKGEMERFQHKPMEFPVIILCDNDQGAAHVFKSASSVINKNVKNGKPCNINYASAEDFFWIVENLYLIKVPSVSGSEQSVIEDLFSKETKSEKLDGKSFSLNTQSDDDSSYGKMAFVRNIVTPNWKNIDFSGFAQLLKRIENCIIHHNESL